MGKVSDANPQTMQSPTIIIKPEPLASPVAQSLIRQLNQSLVDANPDPKSHSWSLSTDETAPGTGIFLVAYMASPNNEDSELIPVGCGAIRKTFDSVNLKDLPRPAPSSTSKDGMDVDAFIEQMANRESTATTSTALSQSPLAEVKRMYVVDKYRGLRVGAKILAELEKEALDIGVRALVLETGDDFWSAIRLYEREGFKKIDLFGEYKKKTVSACFGKLLW
ncbi:hypothetical protein HDU76_000187 [Blyttiomyces sp. JEL0837]|nr:hypothetical protein HDU76_000187 [Blyttiomyces sp. JEL0837]